MGALNFFLRRIRSPDVALVTVESEAAFPSDHYPVRLRLSTLPALLAPAVGLDQFWAQHLRPLLRCTLADLSCVIPWNVSTMPPLSATVLSSSRNLSKARRSTPYRDLIEYCMLEWLHDDQLQRVVDFVQDVIQGKPLEVLVHSDFYALPNKVPHGPIVNARPLVISQLCGS